MRKLLLVAVCSLIFYYTRAQEGNLWYFGFKAGISFNTNPVSPLTDNVMDAPEGTAVVCDREGKLLFYTNGVEVYNRNHGPLLNGDFLMGNRSALQSSLILPVPGSDSLYYLITTDAFENGYENGYRYNLINIKGDNGLGEVIEKNVLLAPSCTERLTAVRHANGTDIWIITNDNNSNIFRSFLLTCSGLQTTPVVSAAGVVLNQDPMSNVGMMKVSPDGSQLCQVNYFKNPASFFQLFDFNSTTGVLSNGRSVSVPGISYKACEFSPSSEFLYMVRYDEAFMEQMEAKAPTAAAIAASRVSIRTQPDMSGIQLGPDGKIYVCKTTAYLSVINNPDLKGLACNYHNNQVSLTKGSSLLQLPVSLNDFNYDPYNNFTMEIIDTCAGIVQFAGTTKLQPPVQWHWDFGDGNTSTDQNPVHQFNPANRNYTVTLTIRNDVLCNRSFRVRKPVEPRGVPTTVDFSFVDKCDSGYIRFINRSAALNTAGSSFEWDFGDGTRSTDAEPLHSYAVSGNYTVKLKHIGRLQCLDDSVSHDLSINTFTIRVSPAQTVLAGQPVQLWAQASEIASYSWTPTASLNNATVFNPVALPQQDTWYVVSAKSSTGCLVKDSVLIQAQPVNGIYIPSGFTPNNDRLNDELRPIYPLDIKMNSFRIYNRWGQVVFSANKRGQGWNGKLGEVEQPAGLYTWIFAGSDALGNPLTRKGTILLIR